MESRLLLGSKRLRWLLFVAASALVAVLLAVLQIGTPTWRDALVATAILAAAALGVECGRWFEGRMRVGQRPHKGLSGWAIATVFLLPSFWVLPVVAGSYAYARWRGLRVAMPQWVASGSFVALAGLAAGRVVHTWGPSPQLLAPTMGASGLILVLGAVLTFLLVESGLLWASAYLNDEADEIWLRETLLDPAFYVTETAVLVVGAITGLVGADSPWLIPLLLPVHGLLQLAVLHRPLQQQAALDAKTGMLHYETWRRIASDIVTRDDGRRPWAVLFADLDHFKRYNDRHGHLAGDIALSQVAEAMRRTVRRGDLLGRFGGEEFCVLLPDTDREQAQVVADRLRSVVKNLRSTELSEAITVSIGLVTVPAGATVPLQTALSQADAAVYQAKLGGRDMVRFATARAFDPSGDVHDCYRHEALVYRGPAEFLALAVPFVQDGLQRGQPVMVAVTRARSTALRAALGADASRVTFVDMERLGRNPAHILPAWRAFVARRGADGTPMRGIGEPIWAGRSASELAECHLHEALLNSAINADAAMWLVCPYDMEQLPATVVAEAMRTHPTALDTAGRRPCEDYRGINHARELFGVNLPDPIGPTDSYQFAGATVAVCAPLVVRGAVDAGLSAQRAVGLAAAVDQVAAESMQRGGGRGILRYWQDDRSFVCEVHDSGVLEDVMVGREQRLAGSGPGITIANEMCDLVQVRSNHVGTTVRVHMSLAA